MPAERPWWGATRYSAKPTLGFEDTAKLEQQQAPAWECRPGSPAWGPWPEPQWQGIL